jgi:acyl dehydratase
MTVQMLSYPSGSQDFSSIVTKAKAFKPEALSMGGYYEPSILLTKEMISQNFEVDLYHFIQAADGVTKDALGANVEGIMGRSSWEPQLETPGNEEFTKGYQDKFGREPSYHSAAAYAAGQVAQAALEAGKGDPDAVREFLASKTVETVAGTYKVNEIGPVARRQEADRLARGRGHREGRGSHARLELMREIVARGRWYEELETETLYRHRPGRTVTEGDHSLFCTLTMNPQSLHLDAAFAARTEFGERLVNSLLTLSTAVGLSVADLTQETTVANLGFEEVTFPHPVHIGDTLYAETVVLSKRPSQSRPEAGVVRFEHTARNQRGDVVARVRRTALMRRAPDDAASGSPSDGGRSR